MGSEGLTAPPQAAPGGAGRKTVIQTCWIWLACELGSMGLRAAIRPFDLEICWGASAGQGRRSATTRLGTAGRGVFPRDRVARSEGEVGEHVLQPIAGFANRRAAGAAGAAGLRSLTLFRASAISWTVGG